MFRFDCNVSHQGVGDQPISCRSVIHVYCELLLSTTLRHRRFTGPSDDGCVPIAQAYRDKNQMSD
jgi:hypothetical protein